MTIPIPSWIPTSFILLSIITALVIKEYKKDKKQVIGLLFVSLFWLGFITVFIQSRQAISYERTENTTWLMEMKELTKNVNSQYLRDESYLDLQDPVIMSISNGLIESSTSAKDYAAKVLNYVDKNVRYDAGESDAACYNGDAPSIIQKGIGQCDTQSMVVVALLRSAYIPSRIVGGCVAKKPSCGALMSFISQKPAPKIETINVTGQVFSRGEFSRTGGLHAFPQAMLPGSSGALEWYTLEATSGSFADTDCYAYYPEVLDAVTKQDICVSKNYQYAQACATNDYATLSKYGGVFKQ